MGETQVYIIVRVAVDGGWLTFCGLVSKSEVERCYALPRDASRAAHWGRALRAEIPDGRGLIWQAPSATSVAEIVLVPT